MIRWLADSEHFETRIPGARILVSAMASIALSCSAANPSAITPTSIALGPPPTPIASEPAAQSPSVRELLAAMDRSADPCENFYQFACGSWVAQNPPTPERPGRSKFYDHFDAVGDTQRKAVMQNVLTGPAGAAETAMADFHHACIVAKHAGESPLPPPLEALAQAATSATSVDQALLVLADIHASTPKVRDLMGGHGGHGPNQPLFALQLEANFDATPPVQVLTLHQGGLGMRDRQPYLSEHPRAAQGREHYRQGLIELLQAAGDDELEANMGADAVLAVETAIATITIDHREVYHRMATGPHRTTADDLELDFSQFPWTQYFQRLGAPNDFATATYAREYFERLGGTLRALPLEQFRRYLRYQVLRSAAHASGGPLARVAARIALPRGAGAAMRSSSPHSECTRITARHFSNTFGRAYVRQQVDPRTKDAVTQMALGIRDNFRSSLHDNQWLDTASRSEALAKVDRMRLRISHPDAWPVQQFPPMSATNFARNLMELQKLRHQQAMAAVSTPWTDEAWPLVSDPGAYYRPSNAIVMFAGILQSPAFSLDAPLAMNYGAVGTIIGHEILHGFDAHGHNFDAQGRRRDWWSPRAKSQFRATSSCMVENYDRCEVMPGLATDGRATLAENMADHGGLKFSFRAYQAVHPDGGVRESAPGLSDDQMFFVSWAQTNCESHTRQAAQHRLRMDSHSFGSCRVNEPLAQLPEFAQTFACNAGAPMRRENSCGIW